MKRFLKYDELLKGYRNSMDKERLKLATRNELRIGHAFESKNRLS
jgi:hypothetical protein